MMNFEAGSRVLLPEGAAFSFLEGREAVVEGKLPRDRVLLRPLCNPDMLVRAWEGALKPVSADTDDTEPTR